MSRRGELAGAALALLLVLFPAAAHGQAAPSNPAGGVDGDPVILVVDVSGSMGDDDGTGRIKIEGAKSALLDFLKGVEPRTPLGLRTYPASDGGSCNSGQLQFPIAARDPTAMAARIRTLTASGDTPTAEAMREAAADLRDRGYDHGTLIIVSDGESTCGDPCDAAKEIASSGISLETITVGFKISKDGADQLRCIANALDGEYVDASQSDKLGKVFDRVSRPALDVSLDYPRDVVAEVGNDNGYVSLKATITNTGGQPARDVSARLRFDSGAPGVVGPVRALGNLAARESRVVEWRFRPSVSLIGSSVKFTVVVRAANGLSDGQAKGEVHVRDETDPAHAGPILRLPGKIAILGDSYSSGEGTHDYLRGTDTNDNSCHRSRKTYLVQDFSIPEQNIIACSGAVAGDVTAPRPEYHVDPQLVQLIGRMDSSQVSAVVVTLGGNNAGFGDVAMSCVTSFDDPAIDCDKKIRSSFGAHDGQDSEAFLADARKRLPELLTPAYRVISRILNSKAAVAQRGGFAPIIVLGYPLSLPQSKRSCLSTTTISPAELAFVVRFATTVNGAVEGAVRAARSEDDVPVFYVPNTEDAFQPDHTLCDREPYGRGIDGLKIAGLDWKLQLKDALATLRHPTDAHGAKQRLAHEVMDVLGRSLRELFHPNEAGYKAMTRAVIRWSLSQDASNALAFVDKLRKPRSSVAATWPASEVDLGQLAAGETPSLRGGTTYGLTVGGFLPGAQLEVVAHSTPTRLAVLQADASGRAATTVAIPPDLSPGRHTIEVRGTGPTGSERVVRIAVKVARRPDPMVMRTILYGGASCYLLALLAWLGVALARRHERSSALRRA